MNRSILVHAGLLIAAFIVAYMVWTRENIVPEEQVPILNWRAGLDRVIYATAEQTVDIARQIDDKGSYYWLRVDRLEPVPTPASKPANPTAMPPQQKIHTIKQFKGNKSVDNLAKLLANLSAIRALGPQSADKLKNFGLETSKKTIKLLSGKNVREFTIGGNTFGKMDLYLQDKSDQSVYVIRPDQINDLNYAEFRLVERTLVGFENLEVDRVIIRSGANRKVLMQQNRRDPATAFWADETAPDKRKELHHNWMAKVSQLRAMDYVQPEKKPTGLTELMTIDFFIGNQRLDSIILLKGPPAPAAPGAPPVPPSEAGDAYYARTDNTRQLVKISKPSAEELVRDLPNIFSN